MNVRRPVLALALLLLPTAAPASDLPVTYTVEEKPLKAAVAGTQLTFTLHRNASCADPSLHTVVWPIEAVTFLARLKMFTPKNGTKIPNTVEIHHLLYNVLATGPLYLKVTGTGITPVGGLCQLQSAQKRELLPAVTVVIRKDLNSIGAWGIEGYVSPAGPGPGNVFPVDETAAWFVSQLNPSHRYSCALRMGIGTQDVNSNWIVPTHGIDVCVQCMSPFPGCP